MGVIFQVTKLLVRGIHSLAQCPAPTPPCIQTLESMEEHRSQLMRLNAPKLAYLRHFRIGLTIARLLCIFSIFCLQVHSQRLISTLKASKAYTGKNIMCLETRDNNSRETTRLQPRVCDRPRAAVSPKVGGFGSRTGFRGVNAQGNLTRRDAVLECINLVALLQWSFQLDQKLITHQKYLRQMRWIGRRHSRSLFTPRFGNSCCLCLPAARINNFQDVEFCVPVPVSERDGPLFRVRGSFTRCPEWGSIRRRLERENFHVELEGCYLC
ncbi:hypothetical protein ONS96_004625 [Cadophora gregata f. sp. sojae]|nr:hypothetical protein ONS96_004625 [Cadophora gregata f. sp. sojae]